MRLIGLLLAIVCWSAESFAQSSPGFTFGQVPTVAQWNGAFTAKQDYLGASPLLVTGGTMTGSLVTAPSTTSAAGINVPPGTAPSSPNNGDVWSTTTGVFSQINGGTARFLTNVNASLSGSSSGVVTLTPPTSFTSYNFNLPATAGTAGQLQASGGGGATAMTWATPAVIRACVLAVNFNSANTDTALSLGSLPTARWVLNSAFLGNASASISTATVGIFTATGGSGQTIAANQAITVTQTAADTNNNAMLLTGTNNNTEAYSDTTVQVRVGTAQGTAATADVCLNIRPL